MRRHRRRPNRLLLGFRHCDQTLFEICSRLAMKHKLGSSRQAIWQHLGVLEAAGLIKTRREGRYKLHTINTEPLERIIERWLQPRTGGG